MAKDAFQPVAPGHARPYAFEPPGAGTGFHFAGSGRLSQRITAVVANFDCALPSANPQLLECFRTRNTAYAAEPLGLTVAWTGEYPGKWLTHCAALWRITQDAELKSVVQQAVEALAQAQAPDGYLAPWADTDRWSTEHWDTWNQYHLSVGCLLWNEATGDLTSLRVASKIIACIASHFTTPEKLYDQGGLEQNMAILHSVACMYTRTKDPKLLSFCNVILAELQMPPAGDYLRNALHGQPYFKGSQTRWEALCGIMGFAELAHSTGDTRCLQAYQQIWWSLCETERHNHGGIMSSEAASGSPYANGSVETCATVTWGAMCVEMLKLADTAVSCAVGDELELSLFNTGLFLLSPSGRWCVSTLCNLDPDCADDSPMNGERISTTLAIAANQNKRACSELSCCAVNGPRIVGLPADWAVMTLGTGTAVAPGFAINLFSAGEFDMPTSPQIDGRVSFVLATEYPVGDGSITITVRRASNDRPARADADVGLLSTFSLWIRIPCWSERNTASINGAPIASKQLVPGQHLKLDNRAWQDGDTVQLHLDFRLRCWLQPLSCCSLESSKDRVAEAATAAATAATIATCGTCDTKMPVPFWTSADASWPDNTRKFDSDHGPVTIPAVATGGAINAAPTTACGWIAIDWAVSVGGECIPFSFGCERTHNDFARALGVTQTQANYYAYEGTSPARADLDGIVAHDSMPSWWTSLHDPGHWHHLAISDDGQSVALYLDGEKVGGGKHAQPPVTSGGAMIGGWAIAQNRLFCGSIAGVELFKGAALTPTDIAAVMLRTKPTTIPASPSRLGCLYRGPLLLGFDPTYNLQAPPNRPPPALDLTKLQESMKVIPDSDPSQAELRAIAPQLLVQVPVAKPATTSDTGVGTDRQLPVETIRLCEYASLGLTGQKFATWLSMVSPHNVELPTTSPFSKADPSRTFFLDSLQNSRLHPLAIAGVSNVNGNMCAGSSNSDENVEPVTVKLKIFFAADLVGSGIRSSSGNDSGRAVHRETRRLQCTSLEELKTRVINDYTSEHDSSSSSSRNFQLMAWVGNGDGGGSTQQQQQVVVHSEEDWRGVVRKCQHTTASVVRMCLNIS